MSRLHFWKPTDDQLVQLLLNRGYLEHDQVAFARLYQALDRRTSLLLVLIEHGYVRRDDVDRVAVEAYEDDQLRQRARRFQLLDEPTLDEATRLQRGSRRTLLQTIADEYLCTPETLAALKDGRPPVTRVLAFPTPGGPPHRTAGGAS